MMRFFSYVLCFLLPISAFANIHTPALQKLVQKLQAENKIDSTLQTESKRYAGSGFERVQFSIHHRTYRILLKNTQDLTFSTKEKNEIAFTVQLEKPITKDIFSQIQKLIDRDLAGEPLLTSSAKAGYTSIFEEDDLEKEPDVITTANVLSWNRLLKDAYQGKALGGGSSSDTSSSSSKGGKDTPSSNLGQASSMAKMMNQCGGTSKSTSAHKQTMKNIAEALVMSQAKAQGEKDDVARASQSYADKSRKYKKNASESITEQLARMKNVDQVSLFKSIQAEKRKIEKALSRNELSYIFDDSDIDQANLKMLEILIDKHSRIKTLQRFQTVSRKLVVDDAYFKSFAKFPEKPVIYAKPKKVWAVNPLLDSKPMYRKALIETLWHYFQMNPS